VVYPSAYCLCNTYSYSHARTDGSGNSYSYSYSYSHARTDGSGNSYSYSYSYSYARSDGSANTYSHSDARIDSNANTYSHSDARIDSNARGTLALADRPPCCGSAGGLGPGPAAQEGPLKQGMRLANNPALDEYAAWSPE